MTPEMVSKSRVLAKRHKFINADFRLGEIENIPVGENTAGVIISCPENCCLAAGLPLAQMVHTFLYLSSIILYLSWLILSHSVRL